MHVAIGWFQRGRDCRADELDASTRVRVLEMRHGAEQGGARAEDAKMTDHDLVREWISLRTAAEIAHDYNVKHRWIVSQWRRLKAAGKLPAGDRPRRSESKYRAEGETNHDGRPSVVSKETHEDELLAKLERGER
jgi:hypothetical protein